MQGAHRRGAGRAVPDDRRAQGAGRLCLPGAAPRLRALRSGAPARGVALDRQLLPRRRGDLAHPRLPRRRRAARGHEPRALRLAGALGERAGGHRPHAGHREQRQGDLRQVRRAGARSGQRDPQPVQRVRQLPRRTGAAPGRRWSACSRRCAETSPGLRLAAFVSASGSAGTLGAGDYLKEKHGARIAAVEAVECPTLLINGYGEHNIQGIGDKHVPLIHNVMNTDLVIGVQRPGDRRAERSVQHRRRARLPARGGWAWRRSCSRCARHFGLSWIANMLAAIKMAKHCDLGPDDVIVTVATDGAAMYAQRARALSAAPAQRGRLDGRDGRRDRRPASARRRHRPRARATRARARAHLQPRLLHLGRAAGRRARGFRSAQVARRSGAACTTSCRSGTR